MSANQRVRTVVCMTLYVHVSVKRIIETIVSKITFFLHLFINIWHNTVFTWYPLKFDLLIEVILCFYIKEIKGCQIEKFQSNNIFFFFKYCHFLKVILDFLISNLQQSFHTICFNSNLYCLVNITRGKYVILLPWQSRKNTEFMVLVMRRLCPLALLYSTITTAYINQILVNLCFITKNRFTLYKGLFWFLSGS